MKVTHTERSSVLTGISQLSYNKKKTKKKEADPNEPNTVLKYRWQRKEKRSFFPL